MTENSGHVGPTSQIESLGLLAQKLGAPDTAMRDAGFARFLASASASGDAIANDETRRAAEQLVAVTFIQPILRAARESNNAAPPFAPTALEKQFGPLMDARLSDSIMRSSRWPLIDRIERDMRANGKQAPAELADRFDPPVLERPAIGFSQGGDA